jgi:peptidoglycan/xylan/chitin deacetylase (PgdA/CDA1 family)
MMCVLGEARRTLPEIVKEIQADVHEVACHGYGHLEIGRQSPDEFLADVLQSKDLLE